MDTNTRKNIESIAWDCTIGAGDDSEKVDFKVLKERLGHEPTVEERVIFKTAWVRCLQEMAQP